MSKRKTIYISEVKPEFKSTYSNSKLGGLKQRILAVSYMPAHEPLRYKDGRLVTDCMGTCGGVNCKGCMQGCYAIRTVRQYESACYNRIANTLHMRQDIDAHFEAIKAECIKRNITTLRYTEAGELETFRQFVKVVELAQELPEMEVYLYTKNYPILRRFFETDELPENMTVLVSIWGSVGVQEYNEFKDHDGIKCFVVNNDEIKADCNCPAYKLNSKGKVKRVNSDAVKCGNCRLCTRAKSVKVIKCLEH